MVVAVLRLLRRNLLVLLLVQTVARTRARSPAAPRIRLLPVRSPAAPRSKLLSGVHLHSAPFVNFSQRGFFCASNGRGTSDTEDLNDILPLTAEDAE